MVQPRTVETRRLDRLARLVISSELSLSLCGSLPAEPSLSESLLLPDDSAPLSPWLPESSPSLESSHLVSNDGLTRLAPTPARADGLDAFREECPLGDAKTSSTWPSFFWHTGERVKDGNSCQQLAAHTHTHTPHTHTQTQTHTHTHRHRHRHRHTDTDTDTQTHTDTHRHMPAPTCSSIVRSCLWRFAVPRAPRRSLNGSSSLPRRLDPLDACVDHPAPLP